MTAEMWALVSTVVVSPVLVSASRALHEYVMRGFAAQRLRHDPLYDIGSILVEVTEGDRVVCGRCRVHDIRTGRIEVRLINDAGAPTGHAMSWTIREFVKRFDPVAEI